MIMDRRTFLAASAGAAVAVNFANSEDIIVKKQRTKPKALKPGDTIGIAAPGTMVPGPDDYQKAVEILNKLNLKSKVSKYFTDFSGYKTRTVESRVKELHDLYADKSVNGIICIRGGYGSAQLLDSLDYKLIESNPKILLGFSDITALHLAINKKCNTVSYHGPVLLSSFTDYTAENLLRIIFDTVPPGVLKNPVRTEGLREMFPTRTIVPGSAKGEIIGGNLTILSTTLGTPYEINTENKILFLEDVGEEPYRIDRMMNQLKLAGKLEKCSGIVFGNCTECIKKSDVWDPGIGEILDNYLRGLPIPSFSGLMIGHESNQLTLPIGMECTMDSRVGTITINEGCVS